MEPNYILEKGEIINFTEGSYSDYHMVGLLIMTETVNLIEFAREHFVGLDICNGGDPQNITSVLVAKQKALPLLNREVYMGDYGFPREFNLVQDQKTRKIIRRITP